MTLTQLRIFITVAEIGHVTRAAEKLGLTQSAVSAAIAALENQYEVKLFDRVGRSIRVSEAGELFAGEARAVLDRTQAAERMLRELGGLTIGHLEIAASQTIANYWLPRRLATFHEQFPGVLLNMTISNTRDVESAVATGAADIGFVEGTTRTPQLVLDEVDSDQLIMVESSQRGDIGTAGDAALPGIPLVVREPGSGTREVLENLALKAGHKWQDLNIVLELPSNEAVREAVEAGAGATLISRHVVAGAIKNGTLRVISRDVPTRSYHMVRHRDRVPSAARRAFVEMILANKMAA
ncbi:MAG: LysR substrate-binding domain-containing protein [Rhodospirillales bacterium]